MVQSPSKIKKSKLTLTKKTFIAFVTFFVILTFASMVALANTNKITVEVSALNVRTGPGLSHDVITQVYESEQLNVLEEQNQWYKVRLSNNETGWVASWLVEEQEVTTESQVFGRINHPSVNVRESSSTDSAILGTASEGQEFQILFEENSWTQVMYADRTGWIHSDYIQKVDQSAQSAQVSDEKVKVASTDVNVRAQATTDSDIVGVAPAGLTYPYLGSENGWYKIQLDNSTSGFVSSSYAEVIPQNIEASDTEPAPAATNISEATIVIDAGHGGRDPGAVTGSTYEKDVTLSTAYILQQKLENAGANVIMSRSDDTYISLHDRVLTSVNSWADAFISLHYDASSTPDSMSGTTTYYYSGADEAFAQTINSHLSGYGPLRNNGVRQGDYYVLRNNPRPAILLELGYMNNSTDLQYIQSANYQATIADAVFLGLSSYFSN